MTSNRARRWASLALVGAMLITAVVTTIAVRESDDQPTTAAAPAPPQADAEHLPADQVDDLRWDDTLGVALPVSAEHGPRQVSDGRAAGFSGTETGAAFAAAHVVLRTSPNVGPAVFGPTMAEQVSGPNRIALEQLVTEQYDLLRQQLDVSAGAPLPGADAEVLGYRVESFDSGSGHVTIQLALTSADLRATDQLLVILASLKWADGDWKLVAPPQGDWATVSHVVTSPPTGMLEFDGVG